MSDIDNNRWKDKKPEKVLYPQFLEEPLISKEDRYKDFDDLRPRKDHSGYRWDLEGVIALVIIAVFLFIMILYWIKWRG